MEPAPPPALAPGVIPPERIDLGDILLRRWQPGDLEARFEAISASFEHIHPWMPWLAERPTLESQRLHSESADGSWPSPDGGFTFGIFDAAGTVLGAAGLHDRVGPATLEIGYWCHVAHTGRGVITRATAALTDIALKLPGIEQVEIRCDAANLRSAAVPHRLGYRLDRVIPRERLAPAESGFGMIWVKSTAAPDN
ncbi:GNAT family N-acetyltransferase [Nocardia jejuensis]|uniref:GNAT family N-acetyltransferase n=1 Tax=Nocardia jejuensis TaxID=328049 RepID=UPI00082B5BC7|nr:GNAT family N-acetyltransferase [Nocardia jejuensis]